MLRRTPPFSLTGSRDNFARRVWFSKLDISPILYAETLVATDALLQTARNAGAPVLAFLLKSTARALHAVPQLNYYTFDGRPVWAGETARISASIELDDGRVELTTFTSPETKRIAALTAEIVAEGERLQREADLPPTLSMRLMNRFPRLHFLLARWLGRHETGYMKGMGPIYVAAVNAPGVYRSFNQPFASPTLIFNRALEGRAVLGLSFNHGLGNVRQIGPFLDAIRQSLETPDALL